MADRDSASGGGQDEFSLGVRRRKWVLAVLIALASGAALISLIMFTVLAPAVRESADRTRGRVNAVNRVADSVLQRNASLSSFLLTGDQRYRSRYDQAATEVDRGYTDLSRILGEDQRPLLADLTAVDRDVVRIARESVSGDVESAGRAGREAESVEAVRVVNVKVEQLRAVVTDSALGEARDAGVVAVQLVALLSLLPIPPTVWVAIQLVRGLRQMRQLGEDMLTTSSEVASSAAELSAAAEELAATSVEGAAAFQEAMATIEDLARSSNALYRAADDVANQSDDMKENIAQASNDIEESSRRMVGLAERVNEIGVILSLINEIADQTNLLALNAAIEAARAGDEGRGFAVVAEEVRRLAERSKGSSADIAAIIESAQQETASTVMSMEKGARQMDGAMSFMEVVAAAGNQGRLTAEAQRSASQQVVMTFEQLAGNTKGMSATTHQIAASAVTLANLAQQLQGASTHSAAGV